MMMQSVMYDIAKEFAEKVKKERSYYDKIDAAVIVSEKGNYAGITGMNIEDNNIVDVPADMMAFLNMRNAGARKVIGMAIIKLADMSFVLPSEKTLQLMFRLNVDNDGCLICIGDGECKMLSELRLGTDMDVLKNGYDSGQGVAEPRKKYEDRPVKTVEKSVEKVDSSTANTISGVSVDESSPFYEKATDLAPPESVLSVMSDEEKSDALTDNADQPEMTPEELLQQAKKRKSIAKSNFLFRKKHS